MKFFDTLRRQKFLSFTVVLLTLSVGVLIGTLLNTGVKAAKEGAAAPGATPLQVPQPSQLQNSFAGIAKALEPSVVNISTEYIQKVSAPGTRRSPNSQNPEDMQDLFRRFFGGPGGGGMSPDDMPRGPSLGSGFVLDRNGYIMTNNHVVEKANRIRVKFNNDPTEYDAKVIGTDAATDLAVIKVEKSNLTPVKIGNSDAIQVGDWAIAIGSPFGFQATVTTGIISAKSRDIPGENNGFQHFLQTDAAINPGNSGGPLLNINAEVIGINTQIASRSGGYQGIGFAMPMNTAVKVYNQIIKNGKVVRGSIGIGFREGPQSRDLLRAFNADHGIFVSKVEPDGPADKAGIKNEDIITSINGQPIRKGSDLIDIVADTEVGKPLKVDLLREGKPQTVTVTVGDRSKIFPDDRASDSLGNGDGDENQDKGDGETAQARFGISIQNLNDRMRETYGLKEPGIIVQSVEPNSFADDIGIQQGDVITQLNRTPVASVDDFKRIQAKFKAGDAVAMRILRNTSPQQAKPNWQPAYVAGTVPANAE